MNAKLEAVAKVTGSILGGAALLVIAALGTAADAERREKDEETLAEASKIRARKTFGVDPKATFGHIDGMIMSRTRAVEILEASGFSNNGWGTWLEKKTGAIANLVNTEDGSKVAISIR